MSPLVVVVYFVGMALGALSMWSVDRAAVRGERIYLARHRNHANVPAIK